MLLGSQPHAALEALCGGNREESKLGLSILEQTGQLHTNPFDAVSEDDLLGWCNEDPSFRYPAVARGLTAFHPCDGAGRPQWTEIALKLLDKAPDRVAVLKGFIRQFSPPGWVGSHAAIVESNVKLLDDLADYPDAALVEFMAKEKIRLAEAIKAEERTEIRLDIERDERFE